MNNDNVNDDEEEEIDEEQLADYCTMLDKLGNFPEKAAINALSISADDFSATPASAGTIYNSIRTRLVDATSDTRRLIPLVYVIDSLLKNVGGSYVDIILNDADTWMERVYTRLRGVGDAEGMGRLKKVWNTWREFGVVKDEVRWKKIGECFVPKEEGRMGVSADTSGFKRNPDGTLQLASSLRRQMQLLLDEVQNTSEVDELDKVSLERLAEINPDLLRQIQTEAEMVLIEQKQQSSTMTNNTRPSFSSDWSKLRLDHLEKTHFIVTCLQRQVRLGSDASVPKSQSDNVIHLYAAVSASAQLLTDMLHEFNAHDSSSSRVGADLRKRRYSLVKREKFTTEGIKERNDAVIARLYEVGLPFVCSADGRRFATQLELSKHLDSLFRKSQLEKMMEKTDERGWYVHEPIWIGINNRSEEKIPEDQQQPNPSEAPIDDVSPSTVLADETRDRCLLCGINFAMLFDQDDGEWKYKNCIEKNVWKDDDEGPLAEEEEFEAVLVHKTCWDGLGRPEFLTADQILQAR